MTVGELKRVLEENNVPSHMYMLMYDGFPNEAFCLARNDTGWEVYYSERGHKRDPIQFEKESAACEYLYNELKEYMQP